MKESKSLFHNHHCQKQQIYFSDYGNNSYSFENNSLWKTFIVFFLVLLEMKKFISFFLKIPMEI